MSRMIVQDVAVRPNRQFPQEPLDVCLFEACETAARPSQRFSAGRRAEMMRHIASVSLLRASAVILAPT